MAISTELTIRSESKCELCFSEQALSAYTVPPKNDDLAENQVVVCSNCLSKINSSKAEDSNYWRCLNESMWTQEPAVQVVIYRILDSLNAEDWAQDMKGMIYLSEEIMEWANTTDEAQVVHKDSNGNILQAGDTVTLIQDLNVKGSSLVAKRGTAVRRIRLDPDNAEYIEGKVDGQHIVILTKYVKKSS